MSDDEIPIRVHNIPDLARFFDTFNGLVVHSGEVANISDPDFMNQFLLSMILSQSLEQDKKLRKDDKVYILYQKIKIKKEFDCSICTDKCEINTDAAQLICDHLFHINCITEWGKYKQDCPICRSEIEYKIR
jgi:hypothetical protein